MQFEEIDNKIREAADHHHPAYNENAWRKMDKLLDKYLPQKKDDRRRIIFFLLLFLLLGSASYLFIGKPWKSSKRITEVNKTTEQTIPVNAPDKTSSAGETGLPQIPENNSTGEIKTNDNSVLSTIKVNRQQYLDAIQQSLTSRLKASQQKRPLMGNENDATKNNSPLIANIQQPQENNTTITSTPVNNNQQPSVNNTNVAINPVVDNVFTKKNDEAVNNNNVSKKEETPAISPVIKRTASKNKKDKFLSLSVSVGPDVSKAGSSNLGQLTWSYGAGINYTMNRFTLRSGFYVAKKIYSAGPYDYTLPYALPANIKLINVDANCRVFEIPVSLAYNFGASGSHSWYAGIGLSSYLMKSEKYKNLYKNTSTNSTYPRSFQYSNENRHYFSVLDLSTGYTLQLNKTLSLSAEPYIKIPMQGIGEGKVHLNSGGILFSLGIRPFQPPKKLKAKSETGTK